MIPRYEINWLQLRIAVGVKLMGEKLSVREAALEAKIGISAISRASNEKQQSAANVLVLCKWLGIDPMNLLVVSDADARGTSTETAPEQGAKRP